MILGDKIKKYSIIVLAIAIMTSCFLLPGLAFAPANDVVVSNIVSDAAEIARAPEYITIHNSIGRLCYRNYGLTEEDGGNALCVVTNDDFLLYEDGRYDSQGRHWVKGQIQSSHEYYGEHVWLLWDSRYLTITYTHP